MAPQLRFVNSVKGPPGFMPPSMPPPQQAEIKPALPPGGDSKIRESLMNLAGPPLTMPPQMSMSHPPPHHMDDNMDVEMEDASMFYRLFCCKKIDFYSFKRDKHCSLEINN